MRCRRGRRGEPMADYYPLIAKAVSGLDKSTGEARRALYDRARTALLAQLRGVEPALSEPDITRERLALEEAIRKVEAEAARRSRGEPLPTRPESRQENDQRAEGLADPPEEIPNPLPRYDLRTSRPTMAAPADDGDDRSDVEETQQAVPLSPAARPVVEARQVEEPRIRAPRAPGSGAEAPPTEQTLWSRSGPSASERALKGFRDGIAEDDGLESATAPPPYLPPRAGGREGAVRTHQTTKAPDFDRFEPRPDSRAEARGESAMEQPPEQPLPRRSSRDIPRPPSPIMRQDDARSRVQPFPRVIRAERGPERAPEHSLMSAWSVPRTSNRIVAIVVMVLLVLAIAGAAYLWSDDIIASIRGASSPARTADQV